MNTPLERKSSIDEIRQRFDNDVERFSNLEAGQQSTIDAALVMGVITQAAVACNPEAKTILDIGCGAGNNTIKLLEKLNPLDCDLVDLSSPMLERAVLRTRAINRGCVRAFQGDFRDLELPAERYDIVISAAMLHHLRDDTDWENTFQKIYQVTAPGGSFWISDLVEHENPAVQQVLWQRYGEYLESIAGTEYKERVFAYIDKEDSPRSLTYQLKLLREVGFDEVDVLHKNACFAAFGARKTPHRRDQSPFSIWR